MDKQTALAHSIISSHMFSEFLKSTLSPILFNEKLVRKGGEKALSKPNKKRGSAKNYLLTNCTGGATPAFSQQAQACTCLPPFNFAFLQLNTNMPMEINRLSKAFSKSR